MTFEPTRREFVRAGAVVGGLSLAGCTSLGEDAHYELWALDQGTDTIYVFDEPSGDADDPDFERIEEIDLNEELGQEDGIVPHMIDFNSDYSYAAVACTVGARTLIFDTETYEIVADVDTGAGSHFAGFSPDDEYVHVDAIGEEAIVRVDADLENEAFEVVDEIDLREDDAVLDAGIEEGSPICHSYDGDGRSIHTLGPSYHDGAVVVVDHDDFSVDTAWSHDELPANCGTIPHPTEDKFYVTAGLPSNPEEDVDGVGDFYVIDTEADAVLVEENTGGIDAHGFWFTPDGEELWVLNRETNDGLVIDPETDEVIEEIDAFGPAQSEDYDERDAPDIMWASPDGEYVFVTLRGPEPLSGAAHAATGVTPGFAVLDVESREILEVVEPDPIEDYSEEALEAVRQDEDGAQAPDFHGIGVAVHGDFDTDVPTSPPF